MKAKLASVIFILASVVTAQASPSSTPRLAELIKLNTKVFSSNYLVFHYENGAGREIPPLNSQQNFQHLQKRMDRFANENFTSADVAGPGVYAAIDPLASREFGGKAEWLLYELTLRKGAKYLDAQNFSISEGVADELSSLGCEVFEGQGIFEIALLWPTRCRVLFSNQLNAEFIGAIAYPYQAANIRQCDQNRQIAFNIINEIAIIPENTTVFSKALPKGNASLSAAGFVEALYKESSLDPATFKNREEFELWNLGSKIPRAEFISEVQQNVWGCSRYLAD